MRTIIIWQASTGPVIIDKESGSRIENCKQLDIAPIKVNREVEATMHVWPETVEGTIQHGLEPDLERVLVEFAPLFPQVYSNVRVEGFETDILGDPVLPRDFKLPKDGNPLHPGDMS